MGNHSAAPANYEQKLSPSSSANTLFYGLIAIGLVTVAAGLATDATRLWRAYLLHNVLFLGLGIGATLFLVVHYLGASGWFVAMRRIPEAFVSTLKPAFFTSIALVFGFSKLYPWTNHELMHSDHFLHHKAGYFGTAFVVARLVVFFAIVLFFTHKLLRNSLRQDSEGGMELRNRQKVLAAGFLVLFAPMFTIVMIDMIKSLEPKWFSTIFGVYMFAGFMQTSMAVMLITVCFLKKNGYLGIVREDHIHDMSKYMFGWSIFWAYICFSQFMLIWYANMPEETFYYMTRAKGSWPYVGALLLSVKFILPFLLMLPRAAKRNLRYASAVACLVVFSEWLDLNWLIMPSYSPTGFVVGWQDVGLFLGFLGLFGLGVRRFLATHRMVPVKDPYLHEAENHHVMFA